MIELNPEIAKIIGMILTVIGVFLAIKIARKAMRIIFMLVSLWGIAMWLYGDEITNMLMSLIKK